MDGDFSGGILAGLIIGFNVGALLILFIAFNGAFWRADFPEAIIAPTLVEISKARIRKDFYSNFINKHAPSIEKSLGIKTEETKEVGK